MEDKVKIVGEPELYDIRGNRLHLEDKVAIPTSSTTMNLGVIVSLGRVRVKVRYINGLLGEVKSTLKRGSWMLNSA